MVSLSRLPAATREIQDPGSGKSNASGEPFSLASMARSGWPGHLSQPPWIRVLLLPASVASVGLSSEGQVLGVDIAGKSSLVQWVSQEDMEYDALTIRAPQRSRWYTRLRPACLGRGCLGRRQQRFPLYLIGYDPVGRFQRAAAVGDVALVERLINASEHHVNECDRRGRSSLHYASAHNHPNVVTLLSSNDCTDINMKDDEGCTPLIKATQRDNLECVSILLRLGADPHIVDANGDAALHHAICRGNIRVVSKLLEYNVDIKAKTEYGLTPYKLALFENQLKMAQFLIENGADAPSELTPNSGGAASEESDQSMKKCANFNKGKNDSNCSYLP
ncbi:hypothetical protein ACRRTK_019697 [Alexandromys fortis]